MAAKVPAQATGNFFTRKLGPAPMWAWIAGAVVLLYGYEWYKNKKAANASTPSTPADTATSDNQPPDTTSYGDTGSATGDQTDTTGNTYDIGSYVASETIGDYIAGNQAVNGIPAQATPVNANKHPHKGNTSKQHHAGKTQNKGNAPSHGRTVQRATGHAPALHTQASPRTRTQPRRPVVRPRAGKR